MIQVPPSANVVVMHESISFRNGIDGTVAIARAVLDKEPMDGAIFVFRNRQRHMLRVLFYDGSGFGLCTKRLSKGRFSQWPAGDGTSPSSALLARELQVLIWGGDPQSCAFPDLWRKVA
jgi:transposase